MIEIPLFPGTAFFTEQVQLESRIYNLRFRYNTALDRWYMDLSDDQDVAVLLGVKLVCNKILNRFSADDRNPTGFLVCQSQTSDESPPAFADLGQRVKLFYAPFEETQAAASLL